MMPVNMLKRLMPTVPIPTVDLHRPIRRLTAQAVGPVVTHADLVAQLGLDLAVRHRVHLARRLPDQQPQHLALRDELDDRELDALVVREGHAEGLARVGVRDRLVEAEYGGAE